MTAVLQYSLPEDQEEYDEAINGWRYHIVLHEIDEYLRRQVKYAGDDVPAAVTTALDEARQRLHDEANDRGVEI